MLRSLRQRPHLRIAICVLTAALAAPIAALATTTSDLPPGVRLVDGYIPRFEQKRTMEHKYGPIIEEFRGEIMRRGRHGEFLPCSSQILEEADWLIAATRDTARVERRIEELRRSLAHLPAQQAPAGAQSETDGSWGSCYEAWFLRMHASVDPLKELVAQGQAPKHPIKFLAEIDTPEKITERFRKLKTSRVIEEGVDHRKELNLTVTGLGQLLFLPSLASVFPPGWPRAEIAAALIAFMDKEWQDPVTGYWGAWYVLGDRVVKTEDLSITFHIASYRDGKIEHMLPLLKTTGRIRERAYPYGWQDRGTQNCHHAYDVVRLARFGWPHLNNAQKAYAQAHLVIILARTLKLAINSVGEPDPRPYNRVAEAYYFCASLLDEIGYLRPSRNFWSKLEFDNADNLRLDMLERLKSLPQEDPMVGAARRKLEARD
jgi:hypothetical protein